MDGAMQRASILYNNIGIYTVNAVMTCGNGTLHCGKHRNVTIPMVDSFTSVISCGINGWSVQCAGARYIVLTGYTGYSIVVVDKFAAPLSNPNIANPVLTVPMGCNPTVTLTIVRMVARSQNHSALVSPIHRLSINGPTTVCQT